MEDQDGLVADIKEVFEEIDEKKPKNGQDQEKCCKVCEKRQ